MWTKLRGVTTSLSSRTSQAAAVVLRRLVCSAATPGVVCGARVVLRVRLSLIQTAAVRSGGDDADLDGEAAHEPGEAALDAVRGAAAARGAAGATGLGDQPDNDFMPATDDYVGGDLSEGPAAAGAPPSSSEPCSAFRGVSPLRQRDVCDTMCVHIYDISIAVDGCVKLCDTTCLCMGRTDSVVPPTAAAPAAAAAAPPGAAAHLELAAGDLALTVSGRGEVWVGLVTAIVPVARGRGQLPEQCAQLIFAERVDPPSPLPLAAGSGGASIERAEGFRLTETPWDPEPVAGLTRIPPSDVLVRNSSGFTLRTGTCRALAAASYGPAFGVGLAVGEHVVARGAGGFGILVGVVKALYFDEASEEMFADLVWAQPGGGGGPGGARKCCCVQAQTG